MPSYEYLCRKCGERFSLTMSIGEHEDKRIECPKCGGGDVAQQLQSFFARTSKKS
jgi:putative FmdB family regulatory protein